MEKEEFAALKKLLTRKKFTGTVITSAIVDTDKSVMSFSKVNVGMLDEENLDLYLTLFRKVLSGTIGKSILQVKVAEEKKCDLSALLKSELQKTDIDKEFVERIAETYPCDTRYFVALTNIVYDIPRKGSDGIGQDESENVYSCIVAAICPMKLQKLVLGTVNVNGKVAVGNLSRDWYVDSPCNGFLYPAMDDGAMDADSAAYFAKTAKDTFPDFVNDIFGTAGLMSADLQTNAFNDLLLKTMDSIVDIDVAKNIVSNLQIRRENNVKAVDMDAVREIFVASGVSSEQMADFTDNYNSIVGSESELALANLPVSFNVKASGTTVKVPGENVDTVKHTVIDGQKYILVPADSNLEVNNVPARL